MRPRPAILSAVLIAGTIAAGLILRLVPVGLPAIVVKYGGSMLWALMVYWIVSTFRPRWSPRRNGVAAAIIAFTIEAMQLYHDPMLDGFRSTLAGALLLGRVFAVRDLAAYGLAIVIGAMTDRAVRRRWP